MKTQKLALTILTLATTVVIVGCGGSKKSSIRLAPPTSTPENAGQANVETGSGDQTVTGGGTSTRPETPADVPGQPQAIPQVSLATLGTRIDSNNEVLYSLEAHVIFTPAELGLPNSYVQTAGRLINLLNPAEVAEGPLRDRFSDLKLGPANIEMVPRGAIADARSQTAAGQDYEMDCDRFCFPLTFNTELITAATAPQNISAQVFDVPGFSGYDTVFARSAAITSVDIVNKDVRLAVLRMIVKPVWTTKMVDGQEVRLIGVEVYRAQLIPDAPVAETVPQQ